MKIVISKLSALLLLFALSKNLYSQVHLAIKVPGRSSVVLNYVNDNKSDGLNFSNPSNHDSVIVKELVVSMPTHLFFSELVMTEINKPAVQKFGSLLVFPEDSIALDKKRFQLSYSTGYQQLLDSILDMRAIYEASSVRNVVEKEGVEYALQHIENIFRENLHKIESVASIYDEKYIQGLKLFNFIIKCDGICNIYVSQNRYSEQERKLLDSCYKMAMAGFGKITSINSPFSNRVIYNLTAFNALQKGDTSGDIWNTFRLMDKDILFSDAYSSFLLFQLNNTFDGTVSGLKDKIALVRNAGIQDRRFDDLLKENQHLSMEAMDSSLMYMPVRNVEGKLLYLKDILEKDSVVYLDIWASWCVPCLAEMPYVKKELAYLNGKKVKYVGLSIDEEQDQWRKAIHTQGLNMNSQFLIDTGYKDALGKALGFKTIPKYLMLGYPDKIIRFDAPRPSDAASLHKAVNVVYENLK